MKIGIALGGGAGLGWAHIGVLKCLHDNGIEPAMVAGTSIGAIVGACYAAGKLNEVEEFARSMTFRGMVKLGQWGFGSGGLISTDKIERELRNYLGYRSIEDCAMPFAAVAADLLTEERLSFTSGDIVEAALASAAVPGVFPPRVYQGHTLIDGGVIDPMPVQSLMEMGADYIIGVDLQDDYFGRIKKLGLVDSVKPRRGRAMRTARASAYFMLKRIGVERQKLYPADLLLKPKVGHIELADFTKAEELIKIGYQTMESEIFSLKPIVSA